MTGPVLRIALAKEESKHSGHHEQPDPYDAKNPDDNGKSVESELQELSLLEDKFAWQRVAHFISLRFPSSDIGPLGVWA